jgi:hypothetical protein
VYISDSAVLPVLRSTVYKVSINPIILSKASLVSHARTNHQTGQYCQGVRVERLKKMTENLGYVWLCSLTHLGTSLECYRHVMLLLWLILMTVIVISYQGLGPLLLIFEGNSETMNPLDIGMCIGLT